MILHEYQMDLNSLISEYIFLIVGGIHELERRLPVPYSRLGVRWRVIPLVQFVVLCSEL